MSGFEIVEEMLLAREVDQLKPELEKMGLSPFDTNRHGIVTFSVGRKVTVGKFSVGGFSASGGEITLASAGTWYVGVDIFSGAVIALPRLGHRGWIPVARVVASEAAVTRIEQILPVIPKSRLPRATKKVLDGQALNVVVMGSSLAEGTSTDVWAGMLFGGSQTAHYKVPNSTLTNIALGGTPNQYQLAQLGLGSSHNGVDFNEAGYPALLTAKLPPNGRSSIFSGVDLVVITVLANGGEYRLQCIEPIIRRVRQMGIEVLLTTDNPQGYPFADYAAITSAALYVDGPEVIRIADMYGCELADTAAYVLDATLRYPTANIYRDAIHMFQAQPAGRVGTPSGGYEVWARAIRSCIPVDTQTIGGGEVTTTYDFNDGTVQGFAVQNGTSVVTADGGAVRIAKLGAASAQWGGRAPYLPSLRTGDTVRVRGSVTLEGDWTSRAISIGLQGGGASWGSTTTPVVNASGTFDVTLTASRDILTQGFVLFFGNWDAAPDGQSFKLDNITITANSSGVAIIAEPIPGREFESQRLPDNRLVTDYKTPGDAFVILPKDETHLLRNDAYKGTLAVHPSGGAAFARRFSSSVTSGQDMLVLTTGQRAAIGAMGVVGLSIVYMSVANDPSVTFEVYASNTLQKTMTIGAQTITRETYFPIYTPTQLAKNNTDPSATTIDIRVTSGTLRICALVALTFDLDFVQPEAITRFGAWTTKVSGGSGMNGYGTDTVSDLAQFQCPPTGRRVSWLCSSKPNSKPIDTWSGRTLDADRTTNGTNHIRTYGNHVGPGEMHYIRLKQTQSSTDQSTNGYGLHIGGIIVVNDR